MASTSESGMLSGDGGSGKRSGGGGSGVSVIPASPFPTIKSSNTQQGTSLSEAANFTLPSGATAGDLVLYFISSDNPSTTQITGSTGWTQVTTFDTGASHRAAIYGRVLDGTSGDNILNAAGAAQDYTAIGVCIENHAFDSLTNLSTALFDVATSSVGAAAANPPNCNPGASNDYLWLAYAVIDKNGTTDSITDDPTDFDLVEVSDSGATSSSGYARLSFRQFTASSLDPGVFTNTARPYIAFTLAITPS